MPLAIASGIVRSERAKAASAPSRKKRITGESRVSMVLVRSLVRQNLGRRFPLQLTRTPIGINSPNIRAPKSCLQFLPGGTFVIGRVKILTLPHGPRRSAPMKFSYNLRDENGQNALRQDLGRPRGRPQGGRHLAALYRPPSRARSDQPAGLRGPAHDGPQGARAGKDAGRRRSQRADLAGPGQRHQERGKPHPGRGAGAERRTISASNIIPSTTSARASSTSSDRSRASRCRA